MKALGVCGTGFKAHGSILLQLDSIGSQFVVLTLTVSSIDSMSSEFGSFVPNRDYNSEFQRVDFLTSKGNGEIDNRLP